MHALDDDDRTFAADFSKGDLLPAQFGHRCHLRLAYVHLATRGPDRAPESFRASLLAYLRHHGIDSGKFHETLTRAWLQAVWHFMQRAGDTDGSDDFLARSQILLDPRVMLTHYSHETLFSEQARNRFVAPDREPIPQGAR